MLEEISFTIPQVLALIGLIQAVYILVHITMRSPSLGEAATPLTYFTILAAAFFLDFAQPGLSGLLSQYELAQWLVWLSIPPLSVLLILKLSMPGRQNVKLYLLVLALPFVAWGTSVLLARQFNGCLTIGHCEPFTQWLFLSALMISVISLLSIWCNRNMIQSLHTEKLGKERYWLVLALILMNLGLLAILLAGSDTDFNNPQIMIARSLIGLSFIYLSTTSLFRVYPEALQLARKTSTDEARQLTRQERAIATKIDDLLRLEKVYQEPSYSRSDLAKELDISEIALSKIINVHYRQSFPQLMNQYRLEDAKRLLTQTKAPVKVIAEEVGFNSLASFNRVFKTEIGLTPSEYRQQNH